MLQLGLLLHVGGFGQDAVSRVACEWAAEEGFATEEFEAVGAEDEVGVEVGVVLQMDGRRVEVDVCGGGGGKRIVMLRRSAEDAASREEEREMSSLGRTETAGHLSGTPQGARIREELGGVWMPALIRVGEWVLAELYTKIVRRYKFGTRECGLPLPSEKLVLEW